MNNIDNLFANEMPKRIKICQDNLPLCSLYSQSFIRSVEVSLPLRGGELFLA